MPVDAVLHDSRLQREPSLYQHLLAAGDDPGAPRRAPVSHRRPTRRLLPDDAFVPNAAAAADLLDLDALPEMEIETPASDQFVDFTTLSASWHRQMSAERQPREAVHCAEPPRKVL